MLAALWLALGGGTAPAGELCPAIEVLAAEASSGLSDGADIPPPPGSEACQVTRALDGGRAVHCAWAFPYRDPAAAEHFAVLTACLSGAEAMEEDRPVNHPDTHLLRRYRIGAAAVTVSLKDKSARDRTYVFVGAAPARPE